MPGIGHAPRNAARAVTMEWPVKAMYAARKVAFNFPDFIEIVLNAGDSRSALGAVMGQSLPNWGKVAQENRRPIH